MGVAPTATASEIKKAYFKKCREHHPDRAQTEDEVQRTLLMFKINDAKEILLDNEKRREYDEPMQRGDKRDLTAEQDNCQEAQEELRTDHTHTRSQQPGNLGNPYDGRIGPRSFFFDSNGHPGEDAKDGCQGSHGYDFGMSGGDAGGAYALGREFLIVIDWLILFRRSDSSCCRY